MYYYSRTRAYETLLRLDTRRFVPQRGEELQNARARTSADRSLQRELQDLEAAAG